MAKLGDDFSGLALGADLLANGWRKGYHASPEVSFTVAEDQTADGGKVARLSKTAAGGNVRDSVEWFGGGQHQNGSAFFRWKIPVDNNPASFSDHQGPAVRVSGDGSGETGLYFFSSQQDNTLNIGWYDNASAGSATPASITWSANEWLNLLVTYDQTSTTYKFWTGDRVTGESSAVSVTTTGGPLLTGYLGMTMFRRETEYDLDFIGFADVGETAPRSMADLEPDTTSPSVTVNALTTSDTTPTVSGVCDDPTAVLSLTVDGVTYTPAKGTTWSQTLNTLAVGEYLMTVTATDAADNVGSDSATLIIEAEGTVYPETVFATGFQDGNNFHPANCTVSGETTLTPTVTIVPREGPGAFYHQLAKITNVNGKTPTFIMDCTNYVGGTVGTSWHPWYALADPSLESTVWYRWPHDPTEIATNVKQFALPDAFTVNDVWIAFQIGYPVGRTTSFLNWLKTTHADLVKDLPSSGSDHIITMMDSFTDELGRTVPAQPMYSYGIRQDATQPFDGYPKRKIVILGGTHAGEHMGDFTMEGFLRWLVSGSTKANDLLRNFEFLVYPCLNPRGRAGGYPRTPPGEGDINRNLDDTPSGTEVVVITDAWNLDIGARGTAKIYMMFTWHGSYYTGEESAIHLFYQSNAEAGYAAAFETILDAYQPVRFQGSTTSGVADEYFRLYYETQHAYTVETAERHDVVDAAEYTQSGVHVGMAIDDTWDQYPSHFTYVGPLPTPINLGVTNLLDTSARLTWDRG